MNEQINQVLSTVNRIERIQNPYTYLYIYCTKIFQGLRLGL